MVCCCCCFCAAKAAAAKTAADGSFLLFFRAVSFLTAPLPAEKLRLSPNEMSESWPRRTILNSQTIDLISNRSIEMSCRRGANLLVEKRLIRPTTFGCSRRTSKWKAGTPVMPLSGQKTIGGSKRKPSCTKCNCCSASKTNLKENDLVFFFFFFLIF